VRRLSVLLLVGALIWVSGTPAEAAFPGGNGRIAFDTSARRRSVQVFTILPTGGDRQQLTSRGWNSSPEWSADGSMIVFRHFRNGTQKLETMSADGSAKSVVLAEPPSGYFDFEDFSWSPDGSQIAFCALSRKYHLDLFVVDSDGTDSTKIAKGACDPSWSPLGGSIAISSFGPSLVNRGIDTIAPDGTGRSRVISGKGTHTQTGLRTAPRSFTTIASTTTNLTCSSSVLMAQVEHA
jgi:Tol biopolymer transport system component